MDNRHIANKAGLSSTILLGNGGISDEMKEEGYIATICATIGSKEDYFFQDLHCTREQLIKLNLSIDGFLKSQPVEE